ncbi:MAG: hypothetical protein ACM31P_12850 [Actinomycetota bacterium]
MNPEPDEFHAFLAPLAEFFNGYELLFSWEDIQALGNAPFTTSLLGALAGAFAGAYMAQRIAERGKRREELLVELRSVNAATALTFEIVNTLLALKTRHVQPLNATYQAEHSRYQDYAAKRVTGQIQGNTPYPIQAELRSIPAVSIPTQMVQDLLFGKISATGRPLNLAASLTEALRHLGKAVDRHNELIGDFRARRLPPGTDLATMYLGLPGPGSQGNREYGDTVSGITTLTDDAIFFAQLLCLDLRDYGRGISDRLRKLLRGEPPRVYAVDFAKARADKLIPNDEDYASWFTAFEPPPKRKRRWWKRGA